MRIISDFVRLIFTLTKAKTKAKAKAKDFVFLSYKIFENRKPIYDRVKNDQ